MKNANPDPVKPGNSSATDAATATEEPIWKADANADFWGALEARKNAAALGVDLPMARLALGSFAAGLGLPGPGLPDTKLPDTKEPAR